MTTRMILLGAALAPYLALVGIDAWMHEKARRVPRLEQFLHWSAALFFLGFIGAVFRGAFQPALLLLGALAAITAWDEIGFHGGLARRERLVHLASYAAFGVFLLAWLTLDSA